MTAVPCHAIAYCIVLRYVAVHIIIKKSSDKKCGPQLRQQFLHMLHTTVGPQFLGTLVYSFMCKGISQPTFPGIKQKARQPGKLAASGSSPDSQGNL